MRNRPLLPLLLLSSLALAEGRWTSVGVTRDQVTIGEHRLTGRIDDRIAQLTFEQEFRSSGSRVAEIFYEFELPIDAAVTSFAMTMDGKWTDGRVLDRGTAKRTYEAIVARKRDPGLLERIGEGRYRARVFPVPARGAVSIRVGFELVLPASEGAVELRLPAPPGAPERFTGKLVLASPREILRIASPTHSIEVDRAAGDGVGIVWNGAPGPFLLRYHGRREAVTFTLLSHRRSGESGTFLAILQPPVDVREDEVLPKDVVFVLDESGSMGGDKLREAKAALRAGIEKLRAGDRFNVLAFSTSVASFREALVAADATTRADATKWIEARRANGGTALDAALQEALRHGSRDRLALVALLTDGLPTVGVVQPAQIVGRLQQKNDCDHRVFVFGVGLDQDARFLDRVAQVTRAVREDITDAAHVVPAMARFYTRVERPVLTGLRLECAAGLSDLQPNPLPDLFAGDEVVVTGRYAKSGPAAFKLHGRLGERAVTHVFEGTLTDREQLACLPRFWAKRQVDVLLAALAAGGDRAELVPAIRELGTTYSLVTPFTAGLVVEDDAPASGPSIGIGGAAGGRRGGTRTLRARGGGARAPVETEEVDDHNEVDGDAEFEESAGEDGMSDAPFTGPSTNSAIGLAGGAGEHRRPRAPSNGPVERGLRWLAAQQRDDGTFGDVRTTADAVLAFLGAGYTDRGSEKDNPFVKPVRTGLRALMNAQRADGAFGDDILAHVRATTALCEAYWMTRNPRYKKPAQIAQDHLAKVRARYSGWPKARPDVRTTAEATLALKSGKYAGLVVDPDAFEGARQLVDEPENVQGEEGATAALLIRVLLGEDPRRSAVVGKLADRAAASKRSDWLADLALFQVGGERWRGWVVPLAKSLQATQKEDGSWGSVAETARACLRMEAALRYSRIFR